MGPPAAASATRGNSRQTDFKGPPLQRIARFCHAVFLLSVTGKQRSRCSGMADVVNLLVTHARTREFHMAHFASCASPAVQVFGGGPSELRLSVRRAGFY